MPDELSELLDSAIYREIATEAFYIAGGKKTRDPGAQVLMQEMAAEERKHANLLKSIRDEGFVLQGWQKSRVPDLKLSQYLTGGDTLQDATSIQDTLILAMKREQDSVDFYSRLMSVLIDKDAKQLCQRLVQEEMKHKYRVEVLYDDMLRQAEF